MTAERHVWMRWEADRWYRRNREALGRLTMRTEFVGRAVSHLLPDFRPRRIVDIGCSDGSRLSLLCQRFGCPGTGYDASKEAIAAAGQRAGRLDFERRHAAALPRHWAEGPRPLLVVLCFILHWLTTPDQRILYKSLRLGLHAGDAIAVADFWPDEPVKVAYHHHPGLWTRKAEYGPIVARAVGARVLGCLPFDHRSPSRWALTSRVPLEERCAAWIVGR